MRPHSRLNVLGACMLAFICSTGSAQQTSPRLYTLDVHCGMEPQIRDVLNQIAFNPELDIELLNAQTGPAELPAPASNPADKPKLELILYYKPQATEVPLDCLPKLLALSDQAKSGAKGRLIVRASTGENASSGMEVATASERLEQVKLVLRNDRLAVRAMQFELLARPALLPIPKLSDQPRIIEIYSRPVN